MQRFEASVGNEATKKMEKEMKETFDFYTKKYNKSHQKKIDLGNDLIKILKDIRALCNRWLQRRTEIETDRYARREVSAGKGTNDELKRPLVTELVGQVEYAIEKVDYWM